MNLDYRHLIDPSAPLPGLPEPKGPRTPPIESAGGIIVSQSPVEGGPVIVSSRRSIVEEEITEDGDSDPIPEDPLAYMSYRAKLVETSESTSVHVQTSYLDSVYYENGVYVFEELEIESASLPLTAYPKFLYLKVPVRFIPGTNGTDHRTDFSHGSYESDPQTINGSDYTFTHYYSTGLLVRDDAPEFVLLDEAVTDMTLTQPEDGADYVGYWYFLIAYIPSTGIRQIHLGGLTLPQPHRFNLLEITVS